MVAGEEVPTFEPLSRVEKYLMAILGGYDVDSLPNPLSRVEVLLYKLAIGDDNLDDFKSFLSEHEELLAEIIRNGGVGGNIDIEYVLCTLSTGFNTLYNTAEKPVKSAILKGNTKYRDIDTGDILDTFDETKNLELVSVKVPVLTTTGKNLADFSKNLTVPFGEKEISNNQLRLYSEIAPDIWNRITEYNFHCEVGEKISIHFKINKNKNENERFSASVYDGNELKRTTTLKPGTVNGECKVSIVATTNNIKIEICPTYGNDYRLPYDVTIYDFQIEKGDVTQYEPFKSNILTVNEEVELRGVGDVQDTLDCLTGEVVQRIYNLQLTGDENWGQSGFTNDGYFVAYTTFTSNLSIANSKLICDKLNYDSSISVTDTKTEGINIIGDCSLRISLSKTKVATLNDFINWIRQEQPVINFVAKEKSIKTVDLSVVDQDGNNTELKTFNDITHVTLSSEGLIPEAELEVATKNEEVLNTMSLEMDDISTTQNALQETSNTQSENVDATMLATTEIYEGLL